MLQGKKQYSTGTSYKFNVLGSPLHVVLCRNTFFLLMNDYVSDLFLLLITWRPRYVSEILITAFSSVQFVLFVAVHFRHCILYYKHSLNVLRILMFHKHTIKCVIRYACFL